MGQKVKNKMYENKVNQLRDAAYEAHEKSLAIINKAEAQSRQLTDSECERLDVLSGEITQCKREIAHLENAATNSIEMGVSQGRKTEPDPTPGGYGSTNRPAMSAARVTGNRFQTADYLKAIKNKAMSERQGGLLDKNMQTIIDVYNAPTSFGSEGVPSDGGFAVPPDVKADIIDKINGEFSILGLCNQIPTPSNFISLVKDETPSYDNSQGPRVYWTGEASQLTESKPLLETANIRLGKLTCLIPISEELSEDAPSLDSYLRRAVSEKFVAEINRVLISGAGAPEPLLGILNADCTVSVAKQSGQPADTVLFANLCDMVARMHAPSFGRAVWHINQDVIPQLYQMVLAGTSNDVPVYLPASGAAGSPYSTLFGRPVIPVESCSTLGDKGDVILADWSKYVVGVKSGGMRTDVSMHLYFDYDMLAYRFVMRLGGQPLWRAAVTPASGSGNTLSCFCTLDERAG